MFLVYIVIQPLILRFKGLYDVLKECDIMEIEGCRLKYLLEEAMDKSNDPPSVLQGLSNATCKEGIPNEHVVIRHAVLVHRLHICLHIPHDGVRVAEVEIFRKVHTSQ